jgi:hypothetical protein
MTKEELVPAIVDEFCEHLIAQLNSVLHYTCSELNLSLERTILIDKDSLIKRIENLRQDYHDEEEVVEVLKSIYGKKIKTKLMRLR